MKPHPRIRKTVKWGGAVVTVLLVGVWVGSRWRVVGWFDSGWRGFWIIGGIVHANIDSPRTGNVSIIAIDGPRPGWFADDTRPQMRWGFGHSSIAYRHHVEIPLWAPTAVVSTMTIVAWHLDTLARRRARVNLCPKCKYDQTGLAAGAVCPECGKASVPS